MMTPEQIQQFIDDNDTETVLIHILDQYKELYQQFAPLLAQAHRLKNQDEILNALADAYRNSLNLQVDDISSGHRSGVRDVAVRLGLYDEFVERLGG